jgi:adenylate kinase
MQLVLLGPPGAGKGTVASTVASRTRMRHISTGDLFRAAVKARNPLGRQVADLLQAGSLVPDSLTISLVREHLATLDRRAGFILDGFPRTVPQAAALAGFAHIDAAVELIVPEQEVVRRLSGRRTCARCGATFNVASIPAGAEIFCSPVQREDDDPEAIRRRLHAYRAQTTPVIEYYRSTGLLRDIDGTATPNEVADRMQAVLARRSGLPPPRRARRAR